MFNGIIQDIGIIDSVNFDGILQVEVSTILSKKCALGDSVSINGVCLTVARCMADKLFFDVVPETIRKSNLGDLYPGVSVNVERALAYHGLIDGHLVQGHIDGIGIIDSIDNNQKDNCLRIRVEKDLSQYLVKKGFIAVDGMSLTVVDCDESYFSVALVPYTLSHTIAKFYQIGMKANIEVDMISKYVKKHVEKMVC